MLGLMFKDNVTILTSYKRNVLLLLVLYTGMAFAMDMPFMLYALVFVTGMYTLSTLSFDEASHWDVYARTLPISPAAVVGAKYLLALFWMAGGMAVSFGLLTAVALLKGNGLALSAEHLLGCLGTLTVVLLYYAVSYPLSYKVGATKARSWTLIVVALLTCLSFYGMEHFNRSGNPAPAFVEALNTMSEGQAILFLLLIVAAALILYTASWIISTVIYRKKEF